MLRMWFSIDLNVGDEEKSKSTNHLRSHQLLKVRSDWSHEKNGWEVSSFQQPSIHISQIKCGFLFILFREWSRACCCTRIKFMFCSMANNDDGGPNNQLGCKCGSLSLLVQIVRRFLSKLPNSFVQILLLKSPCPWVGPLAMFFTPSVSRHTHLMWEHAHWNFLKI